mmetsp:Transcript_141586/g.440150  ORF Transcript_141586/g.440150 Transcript_141586/m.440150 type:complete len:473 (-) Transcript_141586:1801-3219(-)
MPGTSPWLTSLRVLAILASVDECASGVSTVSGFGDDLAIVQTDLRVASQRNVIRAQGAQEGHFDHIYVDWNAGAFGVPKLQQSEGPDVELARDAPQAPQQRPINVPRLRGRERVSQILPVLVVVGIAFLKMRNVVATGVSQVDMRKVVELVAALILFLVSGPAIIILNKRIMKDHHFHFPIVLASLGNVLMMLLTRSSVALGLRRLETPSMEWGRYLRVVVLLNVFNFGTQVLGMWAYMFISVPEIQILKCVTVILVMVFATIFVKEPVNSILVLSVIIIAAGTCLSAIFGNGHSRIVGDTTGAQLIGVLLCVLASTFEAAKTVCSQILMDSLKVFDGIYWSSPAFVLLAMIFIAAIELRSLLHHHFTLQLAGLLALNAVLTGLIVLSSFWFVKLVGALTLKVVTQARSVGLILASVLFFHEQCTQMQYLGCTVSLVGIGLFDHAKATLTSSKKGITTESQKSAEVEAPSKS